MGFNSPLKSVAGAALLEIEKLDAFLTSEGGVSLRKFCKWARSERLSMPAFELALNGCFDERGIFKAWREQAKLLLSGEADAYSEKMLGVPMSGGSDALLRSALLGELKRPGPTLGMPLDEMERKFEVTHVRWVAAPDACPGCAALNGRLFSLMEAKAFIEKRKHKGCRCLWEPVYSFGKELPMCPKDEELTLFSVFCEAERLFPEYEEPSAEKGPPVFRRGG